MDIYKLKFTRLQLEILRLLCIKSGKPLNQREIAKTLGVSPTAVAKGTAQIEKEDLASVTRSKTMNLITIELNRDNEMALAFKRTENLRMIYETGLAGFLRDSFPGGTIILFGSYSLGEDIITSDIDIAVIGRKPKTLELEKYEKALDREININFYTSWKDVHKHLKDNILNGILLYGGVEL